MSYLVSTNTVVCNNKIEKKRTLDLDNSTVYAVNFGYSTGNEIETYTRMATHYSYFEKKPISEVIYLGSVQVYKLFVIEIDSTKINNNNISFYVYTNKDDLTQKYFYAQTQYYWWSIDISLDEDNLGDVSQLTVPIVGFEFQNQSEENLLKVDFKQVGTPKYGLISEIHIPKSLIKFDLNI